MEAAGHRFYNADGKQLECTALMGRSADWMQVRLLWVADPAEHGNWVHNTPDVAAKAKEDADLGMT